MRPGATTDLLIVDGDLAAGPAPAGTESVDLGGRAVIAGLADHHVHLLALAASWSSVDLSPSCLDEAGGLGAALRAGRARQPDGWIRGFGYDVTGSGALDRRELDGLGIGPVRVQDRTGILWVLDSRGLDELLPADPRLWPDGVQRDASGAATGVLVRLDRWLRERVAAPVPDLGAVGGWLASRGVTSVTDAGADNGETELALLAAAGLPQRVVAMVRDLHVAAPPGIEVGPIKVLLDDDRLPDIDDLAGRIEAAHAHGRAVAVHCVTEVQVALALAAGVDRRDRIEHGSVVSDGGLAALARAGPTIVTQPGLVATRGDRYLADHDPSDLAALHRLRSFLDAGLRVAASSDAPYGPADPWIGLAAAVDRRTASGALFGGDEAVDRRTALRLLAGDPHDPGTPRLLAAGEPADLVILDTEWGATTPQPSVLATLRSGRLIAGRLP
ncbi:MAG: amidohydrolase [Acidimicrobiales bacterium]|nr:amidohydrolase [Acidimicrobiales bacterium]